MFLLDYVLDKFGYVKKSSFVWDFAIKNPYALDIKKPKRTVAKKTVTKTVKKPRKLK